MAKDVELLSNTVDVNDTKQIVLDEAEISRPLPWAIADGFVLMRFSILGTTNYQSNSLQIGFWSDENSGVSPMTNVNGGGTISHCWRMYMNGAHVYNAGTPDYWVLANNVIGSKIQNGTNTNISFGFTSNARLLSGDDTRIVAGFRIISSGPVDATTSAVQIYRNSTSGPADVDDEAWAKAKEYSLPAGHFGTATNQSSRDDTTYGVLNNVYVLMNDPNLQLKIHDLTVTKFA
jgi:hypothetical protein